MSVNKQSKLKNIKYSITTDSDCIVSTFILFLFQDQYDSIAAHTQKGIDFLEKYGHFVDQRSKIEQEYASKLR